ncbi:MAG: 6-phosphofructokinase [Saprospiraceae bacterium]|nr:6-phosphofructokinase [Saprospiraceae bacterium]
MSEIRRIAIFTSGGDAPGMNAAIRAVVRTANHYDLIVYGINRGYDGMIDDDIELLQDEFFRNTIQRGGTILKSARSEKFKTAEGRLIAYENLKARDIDAVISIGGNGTLTGAGLLTSEHDMCMIGIPSTIDNDLFGTDFTIGFDTAVNTAVEIVDKIRDTADSHNRIFLIEVMGRDSGYIALNVALASGASALVVPEKNTSIDQLVADLKKSLRRKKLFGLVILAEGNQLGETSDIAKLLKERIPEYDIRSTILGHIQRGGSPTAHDRILAGKYGYEAVKALMEGKRNVMVGFVNNQLTFTSFLDAVTKIKQPSQYDIGIAEILGR